MAGYTTGQAGIQAQQVATPTAYAGDAQELARSQRLAQLLSGQQMPQGEMVSGRFVAPSWTQQLAGLVNAGTGAYYSDQAEKQQQALANKIREGQSSAMADYMAELKGRPATPDKVTEIAGPYTGNVPMPTATIAGRPEIKADPFRANMNASVNDMLPSFVREHAMKEVTKGPKWEKAEYTDEKTGKTRQGVIDVNSANPISTFQVGGVKPEMSAYERASLNMRGAELADQGIGGYGGGGSVGGGNVGGGQRMPANQGGGQVNAQQTAKPDSFTPSTLPAYQYDPSISPKQNREQAYEFSKKQQANITNAKDSFDLMKEAGKILSSNAPSSGRMSNILTGAGEVLNLPFGARKQESQADAKLKVLGGALTSKQPRFEGPQSNIDMAFYKQMAGDLDNPNLPVESRLETLRTMIDLQKKYFPNGQWDTISTTLSDPSKVSLGPAKEVDFSSLPAGKR